MALYQTKKLLHDNGNCINKVKRQLTEWDNIFAKDAFDNRLVLKKPKGIHMLLLLLSHFSHVRLCATPWTAAHQAPPVPGIPQARILEWGAISFSNVIHMTQHQKEAQLKYEQRI